MDVRVIDFKPYRKGALIGFFTLGYGGICIKGCRLMSGSNGNGHWIALPQKEYQDKDGKTQYTDQIYITKPEADFVRRVVVMELERQRVGAKTTKPENKRVGSPRQQAFRTPEGEDLSDYMPPPGDDDIPF